ncbi:MAG: low molecular weight phosphatase family protein [Kordiimonadaceae bacterium]|jgi:protein-tyrosine-phosphatase|nr:low molecular weight phosphatase family protein [Kordiimonadaceae bacterium]
MTENSTHNNTDKPGSVLFVCNYNSIRSPMAEAIAKKLCGHNIYVDSVGVRAELLEINPFNIAVLQEIGIDITEHKAKKIEDLDDDSFDLVITFSEEAYKCALEYTHSLSAEVEYWPTDDPSATRGNRENILESFRELLYVIRESWAFKPLK